MEEMKLNLSIQCGESQSGKKAFAEIANLFGRNY